MNAIEHLNEVYWELSVPIIYGVTSDKTLPLWEWEKSQVDISPTYRHQELNVLDDRWKQAIKDIADNFELVFESDDKMFRQYNRASNFLPSYAEERENDLDRMRNRTAYTENLKGGHTRITIIEEPDPDTDKVEKEIEMYRKVLEEGDKRRHDKEMEKLNRRGIRELKISSGRILYIVNKGAKPHPAGILAPSVYALSFSNG